ncbi:MAG TPA: hypothetical protein VL117_00440 [Thermoleophilia bacterium]|nr:hypothetical protein [Thermoleophilia bacterium]
MNCVDLNSASRELLPPECTACTWWQSASGAAAPEARSDWEASVEAEAGMFGRALLEGGEVLGWMQIVPAGMVRGGLPTGPPSPDAYLLACAFFYDDQFLAGFQTLLLDVIAAVKLRHAAALEAYALRRPSPDDRFVGYLHELNLFNSQVLEGSGFTRLRSAGKVGRYRLELETLVAAPRRSRAVEQTGAQPATIPA